MTDTPPVVEEIIAKPAGVVWLAVTIGAALAVAALVRKFGQALPLPEYVTEWLGADDPEQYPEEYPEPQEYDEAPAPAYTGGGFVQ